MLVSVTCNPAAHRSSPAPAYTRQVGFGNGMHLSNESCGKELQARFEGEGFSEISKLTDDRSACVWLAISSQLALQPSAPSASILQSSDS